MKKIDYTKCAMMGYLKIQERCVFKTTVLKDLTNLGFKKTNINKGLAILRKEKKVCLYRRRWGLI